MRLSIQHWIRISLFNLLLVAAIGVTLRYKIAFALPFIDQKHLLHGHSHFAFAGWVTQTLMVLLVAYLAIKTNKHILGRYGWLLTANLICSYGMLIAFIIEGYGSYSIFFSTAFVLVSYVFAVMFWTDLNKLPSRDVSHLWFKAAVLFNAVSSLGTFALAGMMINKIVHQNWYLAAEYFYLHFQYNGWFFFSCMGLLVSKLDGSGISQASLKNIFRIFTAAFVPAYLLSILWVDLPLWIYIIVVVAAFIQVWGWAWFIKILKPHVPFLKQNLPPAARQLLVLSSIALSIKLLLQLGSVIPSLSDLSYGFRPIIIGYLHLVLLGIITLFILGFLVAGNYISITKITLTGIIVFTAGIIINEIFLMLQGVAAMSYNNVPFINELLLIAALIMFAGLTLTNLGNKIKMQK